jgi:hypothetical protein
MASLDDVAQTGARLGFAPPSDHLSDYHELLKATDAAAAELLAVPGTSSSKQQKQMKRRKLTFDSPSTCRLSPNRTPQMEAHGRSQASGRRQQAEGVVLEGERWGRSRGAPFCPFSTDEADFLVNRAFFPERAFA